MFFMNVILFIFVGAGGTRQIEKRSAPLPQASQWHEDVLWYGAAASLCSSWHFRWRRPDWKVRAVGWVGGFLADFFTSSISPSATPPHSISQSLALPCDVPRQIRQAVWWSEGTLDYCLNIIIITSFLGNFLPCALVSDDGTNRL